MRVRQIKTGKSIAAKLNLMLLGVVAGALLIAGMVLGSWLSGYLENRGVEELRRINQQVIDMIDAYSKGLERSTEMLGTSFGALLPQGRGGSGQAGPDRASQLAELPGWRRGDQQQYPVGGSVQLGPVPTWTNSVKVHAWSGGTSS